MWLVHAVAMASHKDDRHAAQPLLHHPLRRRHRPEAPRDVSASFDLPMTCLPGYSMTVGEQISDKLKPFAAPVFDGDSSASLDRSEALTGCPVSTT